MNEDFGDLVDLFGTPSTIDNTVVFNLTQPDATVNIRTSHGKNIVILPSKGLRGRVSIDLRSENSCIYIGSGLVRADILAGYGCKFILSDDCSFTRTANFTLAEEQDIFVGEKCMFAEDVFVSNTDGHPIFDSEGVRINHGKSVAIGHGVWIGRCAEILKGSVINSGAVVGARSVVAGASIPANSICVGNPARVVRQDAAFERRTTVRSPIIGNAKTAPKLYPPLDIHQSPIFGMLQGCLT